MKTILVTGASGFIGTSLCSALRSLNYDVAETDSKKGDIRQWSSFESLLTLDFDHVFHLAGKSYVPDSWVDPMEFYNTNVIGTGNVLEFCRKKNIPMTYVSAYLYGQPERLPISENSRIEPNNPYAHSKYLSEQLCEFYAREFNVWVAIFRPFNIFGVGQDPKFLIPSIIKQVLDGDDIVVKDLQPKRDYIYLKDLIEALILSVGHVDNFSIYNIGSGYSFGVDQIIKMIQDVCFTQKTVKEEKQIRRNEINNVIADISKAKKQLGWTPKYSFQDGIREIINDKKARQNAV